MKNILVSSITIYQKTLSPDHGPLKQRYPHGYCRFYPSCSEYTKLAIIHNGSLKGSLLGIKRIAKCNPWVEPRVDLSYNSKLKEVKP